MFKAEDKARIRGTDQVVSIIDATHEIISTTGGDFQESHLQMWGSEIAVTSKAEVPNWPRQEAKPMSEGKARNYLRDMTLYDKLENLPVEDLKGHFHGDNIKEGKDLGRTYPASGVDYTALHDALDQGVAADTYFPVMISRPLTCPHCGEEEFQGLTNGVSIKLQCKPCPYPEGLPPQEWEINVPSGLLYIENDLRDFYPIPKPEGPSVNYDCGIHAVSKAYAEAGLAHGFVGNTCPGVYFQKEGEYIVAKSGWLEDGEEVPPTGECVASICTDLWWYCMADADDLRRRAQHYGLTVEGMEPLEVKPGVYRFKHYLLRDRDDYEKARVYSEITWVREPDPVVDLLKNNKGRTLNAHSYVQEMVKRWPTLYGQGNGSTWVTLDAGGKSHAWQRIADQIFFTIGSGTDWHESGFPDCVPSKVAENIDPPAMREQQHWYPFSERYGGAFEQTKFETSFAKLLFRSLESVISFGLSVRTIRSEAFRGVAQAKERMLLAVKRYMELAPLYPEAADHAYVAWLSEPDRAENWVANFDLGPEQSQEQLENLKRKFEAFPLDATEVSFDGSLLKNQGVAFPTECQNAYVNLYWFSGGVSKPVTFTARIVDRLMSTGGDLHLQVELEGETFYIPHERYKAALTARSA